MRGPGRRGSRLRRAGSRRLRGGVGERGGGVGRPPRRLRNPNRPSRPPPPPPRRPAPGVERLGRVRPVAAAQVRYDSPLDFVRVVRGELRHRRLFVATEDPRPVGTQVQATLTAPQLPDGLQLQGEVESVMDRAEAQRQGSRAGMYLRLTDLTDEQLADLELRVKGNANPIAMTKAAKLAQAANDDLKEGKRSSAIANLKLALSFDPTNRDHKKLLDELVAEQNAQLAAQKKHLNKPQI